MAFLDLFYPRLCAGCGGPVGAEPGHLCWDCLAGITYVKSPYCSLCGDPVEGRIDGEFICYNCTASRPHFDRARSAARYTGSLQNVMREFKYRKSLWVRRDLAGLLAACADAHYDPEQVDAVCFVPLYPAREREREYNQAGLLARALARRMGKPLLGRCLARIRPTPSQTNLTARARATNVAGAFRARWTRRLKGRRVLLVDDVMTTGATVSECARVLKEGGAVAVYVVTVARG
jgi:ComF family protein